jgi:hypothetical protein
MQEADTFKDRKIAIIVNNEDEFNQVQKELLARGAKWMDGNPVETYCKSIKILLIDDMTIYYCPKYSESCKKDGFCHGKGFTFISAKEFLEKYSDEPRPPFIATSGQLMPEKPKDREPKFKVGDYLYTVTSQIIYKLEITQITSERYLTIKYSDNALNEISGAFTIPIDKLHCQEPYEIFSTPELATKRFLELNK